MKKKRRRKKNEQRRILENSLFGASARLLSDLRAVLRAARLIMHVRGLGELLTAIIIFPSFPMYCTILHVGAIPTYRLSLPTLWYYPDSAIIILTCRALWHIYTLHVCLSVCDETESTGITYTCPDYITKHFAVCSDLGSHVAIRWWYNTVRSMASGMLLCTIYDLILGNKHTIVPYTENWASLCSRHLHSWWEHRGMRSYTVLCTTAHEIPLPPCDISHVRSRCT